MAPIVGLVPFNFHVGSNANMQDSYQMMYMVASKQMFGKALKLLSRLQRVMQTLRLCYTSTRFSKNLVRVVESQKPSGWDARATFTSWYSSVLALPLWIIFGNVGRSFPLILWPSLLRNWWARNLLHLQVLIYLFQALLSAKIHSCHYIHCNINSV